MEELVVLSGKGGTGKTSLTAAFASLCQQTVICDADVDAADLHLLSQPEIIEKHDFMGGGIAEIEPELCSQCGTCIDYCRFGAINSEFQVNPLHCEGCGVCVDFCPEQAIRFPAQKCGEWFVSRSKFGPMVHAALGVAQENSGKLVSLVRKEAGKLAEEKNADLLLTDGPPGIGCPVIASMSGATAIVLVVEPTVSGVHDMQRVAELAVHFKRPCMLCVNKYDLNLSLTEEIENMARSMGITLVGRIPFDSIFVKSMVKGQTVLEYDINSPVSEIIKTTWQKITEVQVENFQL